MEKTSEMPWPVVQESSEGCDHKFQYIHSDFEECLYCGLPQDNFLNGVTQEKLYGLNESQARAAWEACKALVEFYVKVSENDKSIDGMGVVFSNGSEQLLKLKEAIKNAKIFLGVE